MKLHCDERLESANLKQKTQYVQGRGRESTDASTHAPSVFRPELWSAQPVARAKVGCEGLPPDDLEHCI